MKHGAAGIALLFCTGAAWGDVNMQPGLWDDQTILSDGTVKTDQKCFLARDIENTARFQRGEIADPEGACIAHNYKAVGDAISYTLVCTAAGATITSEVQATYEGDHATATVTRDSGVTRLTRHRIGDCDKSSFSK
jgi:hypothetical protein